MFLQSATYVAFYFLFHFVLGAFAVAAVINVFGKLNVRLHCFQVNAFPREALDFILVLRCLRLVRIAGNIERFKVVLMTIVNIGPSLFTYGIVLLVSRSCVCQNLSSLRQTSMI